ncbi:MAG: cytochrome-c peroxidase [Gammaproteobacteria bacterium]|nr:cytochrome-c peroxidase [Gammaproteobacteria bacterium]
MLLKCPIMLIHNFIVLIIFIFLALPITTVAEPIKVLTQPKNLDKEKVALGRLLFFDKRLSKDNSVSCETCHLLKEGGDDNIKISIGINGRKGIINAPTVYNSGLNFRQFWDGRAPTLEIQALGPVQNPVEMGAFWPDVIAKLQADHVFSQRFIQSYPLGINRQNVTHAIAEFERSLVTTDAPFDRYLNGDASAISEDAKEGYQLFKKYGCVSCHQGAAVGGNMYQVFGVVNSYFKKRGNITEADYGRFGLTANRMDMHSFKVPSLRMVAHTSPYFHDGSVKTLREAVDVMFEFQLGREAPDQDKDKIVSFLKTLAGKHKEFQ